MTAKYERISRLYREEFGDSHLSYFKRNPGSSRGWIIGLVLAIVILALLAALVGMFIFGPPSEDSAGEREAARLEIKGPESISAGENLEYLVSISNPQKVDFVKTELRVIYPEEFYLESVSPEPTEVLARGGLWRLGDFEPGQIREVRIKGVLFGELGQTKQIRAFFNFEPADFRSRFQKEASFIINIDKSSLELTFDGPEELIQGQVGEFRWNLEARRPQDIVGVILISPEAFKFLSEASSTDLSEFLRSTPQGEKRWQFEKIDQDEIKEASFRGYLVGELGNWQFKLKAGLVDGTGKFYLQEEKSIILVLKDAPLSLGLEASHKNSTLSYKINYENSGVSEIKDLKLTLVIKDGRLIDWSGPYPCQVQEARASGQVSCLFPTLVSLLPGEKGEATFDLKKVSEVAGLPSSEEQLFWVEAYGRLSVPEGEIEFRKYSNQVVLKSNN